jgi:hypothetical protein
MEHTWWLAEAQMEFVAGSEQLIFSLVLAIGTSLFVRRGEGKVES